MVCSDRKVSDVPCLPFGSLVRAGKSRVVKSAEAAIYQVESLAKLVFGC